MSAPPQAQEEYEDVSDGEEMVTDIDAVTADKGDSLSPSAPQGGRSDEVARLTIEVSTLEGNSCGGVDSAIHTVRCHGHLQDGMLGYSFYTILLPFVQYLSILA